MTTPPNKKSVAISSAKAHREKEMTELQQLNSRLEAVVVKQREKDENQGGLMREIEKLRVYYEKEIDSLTAAHEDAVAIVRAKRDEHANDAKLLKENNKRQEAMIAGLRRKNDDLEGQLQDLQKEMEALQNKNTKLAIELQQLKTSFKVTKSENERVERERDEIKQELKTKQQADDVNGKPSDVLQSQLRTLQEEYDIKCNELKEEKRLRRTEREQSAAALEVQVRDIRAEFTKKMTETLRNQAQSLNEKMAELRERMEKEYTQQLADKADELARALERLQEEANQRADAEAQLGMNEKDPERMVQGDQAKRIQDLQKQIADNDKKHRAQEAATKNKFQRPLLELTAERDALKNVVQDLEGQLGKKQDFESTIANLEDDAKFWKDESGKLQKQLATTQDLNREIASLEAKLKSKDTLQKTLEDQLNKANNEIFRKDEDYESLLGLKVALDMEIKSFRWLLENEESRLGMDVPPSSKKRKRDHAETPAVATPAVATPAPASRLKPKSKATETPLTISSSRPTTLLPSFESPPTPAPATSTPPVDKRSAFATASLGADINIRKLNGKKKQPVSLEIANDSDKDVLLDGWSIRFSDATSHVAEYSIPDLSPLRPGEAFTVWLSGKAKGSSDRNVQWSFDFKNIESNSKFSLVNPYGSVQSDVACK